MNPKLNTTLSAYARRVLAPALSLIFVSGLSSGCSEDVSFSPDPTNLPSGVETNEKFTQGATAKKIDILFVVDNSMSMAEEQLKLGQRISSFLSQINDIDWHIGITTTDVSNGRYGLKGRLVKFAGTNTNILTRNTPNYVNAFLNTVQRQESVNCGGECPSGSEQPLAAAIMAMNLQGTTNRGFFRDGADLGVMILSDEDEMSAGPRPGHSPPPWATPAESVLRAAENIWSGEKNLVAYGMVIKPNDVACLNAQPNVGHYGTFVASLVQLTNGVLGSICQEDYGTQLGQIGNHVRQLLDYIQLRSAPLAESVLIQFTPAHTTTWVVRGKRIYFDTPPPEGTVIEVGYTVK